MQPSREMAPTASGAALDLDVDFGVSVAQLMKVLPLAPTRRESPVSPKTASWDASSVTTVMMSISRCGDGGERGGVRGADLGGEGGRAGGVDVVDGGHSVAAIFEAAGHVGAHATDSDEGDFFGHEGRSVLKGLAGEEGIVQALLGERGEGAVAAGENGIAVEGHELGAVVFELLLEVRRAATHGTGEDGVADDGERPAKAGDDVGGHAGGVAKRVKRLHGEFAEMKVGVFLERLRAGKILTARVRSPRQWRRWRRQAWLGRRYGRRGCG